MNEDDSEKGKLDSIEEELKSVRETKFLSINESERSAQIEEIEARAKAARNVLKKHQPEGQESGLISPGTGQGLGKGLQIAYAILGVPLVGFGVGYFIDQATGGGTMWRGVLTILGGAIAVWYAIVSGNSKQ